MSPFSAFYNKYKDKLFGYLLRRTGDTDLSEDIMQESFTRYLEHYGSTKVSPTLLFTIARNILMDNHRNAHQNIQFGENLKDPRNPEDHLMVREEYRRILSALKMLNGTERDILALVVSSRLSYREIAEIAGITEANVKVTVHRARTKLRQILSKAMTICWKDQKPICGNFLEP